MSDCGRYLTLIIRSTKEPATPEFVDMLDNMRRAEPLPKDTHVICITDSLLTRSIASIKRPRFRSFRP